jgi:hypothetical protein
LTSKSLLPSIDFFEDQKNNEEKRKQLSFFSFRVFQLQRFIRELKSSLNEESDRLMAEDLLGFCNDCEAYLMLVKEASEMVLLSYPTEINSQQRSSWSGPAVSREEKKNFLDLLSYPFFKIRSLSGLSGKESEENSSRQ